MSLAIWTSVRPGHHLSRGTQHIIFRTIRLSGPCKVELAEPEEAVILSEKAAQTEEVAYSWSGESALDTTEADTS